MMVSIAGLENSARLMGPVTQYLVWRHCPARRGLGYRDTGDWWQVSPGDWGQCSCYLQWRPRDTPLSHGWWHGWWRWDSFRERRYLATIWGRGHWCDPGWKYQSTKRIPLKWLIKNFAAVYKINIHRRSIHKLCLCTIRSLSSHIMFHRLCLSMVLSLISLSLEFLITWSLDFLITIKFARDKIRNRLHCCWLIVGQNLIKLFPSFFHCPTSSFFHFLFLLLLVSDFQIIYWVQAPRSAQEKFNGEWWWLGWIESNECQICNMLR